MSPTERVFLFASHAHEFRAKKPENRFRKYTNEPYIIHPIRVAAILHNHFLKALPEPAYIAAFLHDVLEDTTVTEQELRAAFGSEITNLVVEVTDVSKPEDGNRAKRKEMDRQHLANASPWGQNIKLADLVDNGASIFKHDPKFGQVFRKEKNELLCVLLKGDDALWVKALHCMMEE